MYSSNVSRVQYQAISTQPGMDIWYISNNNIDVRVSWENVMWLRQLGIHCTILHDSVEQLVKQFEKDLMVKQEWFEEYVSLWATCMEGYTILSNCTFVSVQSHMSTSSGVRCF